MTIFSIFIYSMLMVTFGYMIGHNSGEAEGYIDGRSEMYKEKR